MSAADIYAECLLPLKEGYPLYRPELHRRLNDDVYDTYRREGISIGDVGIIRPGGDFDFLFNICKTRSSNLSDTPNASNELSESLGSGGSGSLGIAGTSEQPMLPSTTGDIHGSSPSSVSYSDARQSDMSDRSLFLVGPHTAPANFELIDAGEISITPEYVSTDRPYIAHGREEQIAFNAEASLNPIA